MALNKLKNPEDYIQLLREKPLEVDNLYKDLLINVTSFFREPALYDAFAKKIFPLLFKNKKTADPIRIWIPACASGEEACSIAICLFEYLGEKSDSDSPSRYLLPISAKGGAIEKLGRDCIRDPICKTCLRRGWSVSLLRAAAYSRS